MRIARASSQLQLLSVAPNFRATSNASARCAYGSAAQEIVCAALDIKPIPINGNCEVCFDAEGSHGEFYEIKSVRRGHKVVLYDWRMRKEKRAKKKLFYAILIHRIKGERHDIMWRMLERCPEILIIRASLIHRIAKKYPKRKLLHKSGGPRSGYNRKGYRSGYRNVPIAAIQALTKGERWVFGMLYERSFVLTVLQ